MPRNRKLFINKTVLFITTRTLEGLPFIPSPVWNTTLWSILAKAQQTHPVKVCHFVFMANHLHMLVVVEDPENIPKFMAWVKRESAYAVNAMAGIKKRNVWEEGYDSPVLGTPDDVIERIAYIYLNPVRAHQCDRVDSFKGVWSWGLFANNDVEIECRDLRRSTYPSKDALLENSELADEITFHLKSDAWYECFGISCEKEIEQMNNQIIKMINDIEDQIRKEGSFQRHREMLKNKREKWDKEYRPKKYGKRSLIICSNKNKKIAYLDFYRRKSQLAKKSFDDFDPGGDLASLIIPGMFFPGMMLLSNVFPSGLVF